MKLKNLSQKVKGAEERASQSYNHNFDINQSAYGLYKRSKSTVNIMNQEGDFEMGTDEDGLDYISRSNQKAIDYDEPLTANRRLTDSK